MKGHCLETQVLSKQNAPLLEAKTRSAAVPVRPTPPTCVAPIGKSLVKENPSEM